jgi:hypothetical protein
MDAAEQALAAAHALPTAVSRLAPPRVFPPSAADSPHAAISLFGGTGRYSVVRLSETIQQIDMHYEQTSSECGIRFERTGDEVLYCPSGMEEQPARLRPAEYAPPALYLPLANGFLGLGENLALIRVNRYGMPAARVASSDAFVQFGVEGGRRGTIFRWRFLLHRGTFSDAIAHANAVNFV